jgi:hypothetical protein
VLLGTGSKAAGDSIRSAQRYPEKLRTDFAAAQSLTLSRSIGCQKATKLKIGWLLETISATGW